MLPIKKILCPSDFSEFSNTALETAGELAECFGAELLLLHVLEPITPEMVEQIDNRMSIDDFRQAQITAAAWRLRQAARERVPKGLVRATEVRYGDAAEEIVYSAADNRADLIAIAKHGERNWRYFVSGSAVEKFIMGSVTETVIGTASCPVMTVPHRLHAGESLQVFAGISEMSKPKAREEVAC